MTDPAPRTATIRAALWMLGAIASFTFMAVGGRSVADVHDTFEIMLYRSVVGVIIVVAVGLWLGRMREVRRDNLRYHVFRNLAHFTGQNLWFYAVTLIPLAQVFALEFTSPLWVLLLAPLILGERVRPVQYLVAIVGFSGVLLVARPFSASFDPALIFAGLAALFFALTNLMTRKLTRNETVLGIMFWLTTLQLIFGLVTAGIDGQIALPTAATLPWVVTIGIAGLCAHFCLTNALSLAPASTIMPVDFARLPIIALVGALVYGEALDPLILAGGAIIVAAAWANLKLAERS